MTDEEYANFIHNEISKLPPGSLEIVKQAKEIPGFPGYYVSNDGKVYSCFYPGGWKIKIGKPKLLAFRTRKDGYQVVYLTKICNGKKIKGNYLVHGLVLATYVGPRPEKYDCRHLNGKRSDNRLINLRWGTRKENIQDSIRHGTHRSGDNATHRTLSSTEVKAIRKLLALNKFTQTFIGALFKVSGETICLISQGKIWKDAL